MRNKLINKLKKLAIIPILAGSLNSCGNQTKYENSEILYEKGKVIKHEVGNFVEFDDGNGSFYTDLGKDGKLDLFYNGESPMMRIDIEIVDDINEANYSNFGTIYRNSDYANKLQKQFELVKQNYEKQNSK